MRSQGIKQILAELELLSHGKTASYNSNGAGETTAALPYGELAPPHEYWRDRYNAAGKHDRAGILEHARRELEIWKKRQAPAVDAWDEKKAILEDGEGHSADIVARKFKRTPTYIRRLRLQDDRESEYGTKTNGKPTERVPDAHERIVNLAAQGCTERQIAFQVGVSKTTVRRALGKAA